MKPSIQSSLDQLNSEQLDLLQYITKPLMYYGGYQEFSMAYISDMHLETHLVNKDFAGNIRKMLDVVSRQLYNSYAAKPKYLRSQYIIFLGDTAIDRKMTIDFYRKFRKRFLLDDIKHLKSLLSAYSATMSSRYFDESYIHTKRNRLALGIAKYNDRLLTKYHFDYKKFSAYKTRYAEYYDTEYAIRRFQNTKTYKAMAIPEKFAEEICSNVVVMDKMIDTKARYDTSTFWENKQSAYEELKPFIDASHKTNCACNNASDSIEAYVMHQYEDKSVPIFVMLGNHEYSDFDSVADCTEYYQRELKKLHLVLLQNAIYNLGPVVILGGTGFAKYDLRFNASTLVGPKHFTRQLEIEETEKFEKGFNVAYGFATKHKMPLVCCSHYPVEACLGGRYIRDVIYFSGHDHRNRLIQTEDCTLYADNQVGYSSQQFRFQTMSSGTAINPYIDLPDGVHETTPELYEAFGHYINTYHKTGTIRNIISSGRKFYVIKHHEYYGFFLVSNIPKKKSIAVVNGGNVKKFTRDPDILKVDAKFEKMVTTYLNAMIAVRSLQQHLSEELKRLGLDGTIHGLIIDLDVMHHIMVNPLDCSMTMYYSPEMGWIQKFNTFNELLLSMQMREPSLTLKQRYHLIEQKVSESRLLPILTSHATLVTHHNYDESLTWVGYSDAAYKASRIVSKWQRLFDSHVLRDFDMSLLESDDIQKLSTIE